MRKNVPLYRTYMESLNYQDDVYFVISSMMHQFSLFHVTSPEHDRMRDEFMDANDDEQE